MLNKLIKFILVLAIFTVPLFFLPFTLEQYQFNKEMLFVGLILLAGLLWIGGAVRQKKLEIVRTPLDIPILLVVLVYGLATIDADHWIAWFANLCSAGFLFAISNFCRFNFTARRLFSAPAIQSWRILYQSKLKNCCSGRISVFESVDVEHR